MNPSVPPKTPEKSFDEVIVDTFINIFTCNIGSPAPYEDTTTYTATRSDHDIARDKYKQSLSKPVTNVNQMPKHQPLSTTSSKTLNRNHQASSDTLSKLEQHQEKLKLDEEYKKSKNQEFAEKINDANNDNSVLSFFGLSSSKQTNESSSGNNNSDKYNNISAEQFEYYLGTEGVEAIIWLPTPKGKSKGKTSKIKLDRFTNSIKCDMLSKGEKKSLFFQLSDLLAVTDGKGTGSTGTMPIALPAEAENNRSLYITIRDKPELNLTFATIPERDTFLKGLRLLINRSSSNANNMAAQAQLQSLLAKVKK